MSGTLHCNEHCKKILQETFDEYDSIVNELDTQNGKPWFEATNDLADQEDESWISVFPNFATESVDVCFVSQKGDREFLMLFIPQFADVDLEDSEEDAGNAIVENLEFNVGGLLNKAKDMIGGKLKGALAGVTEQLKGKLGGFHSLYCPHKC